jgi:hypothetical protein
MSEITDDLFDAFRNVYLALESLLNRLQPKTPGEREGPWLRRALTLVHETAGLETYLAAPPHRGHWPAIAYHKDPKQTELREPAGYLRSFSLRNCRAASATSCQPLSKTREWPRPGCTVEAD